MPSDGADPMKMSLNFKFVALTCFYGNWRVGRWSGGGWVVIYFLFSFKFTRILICKPGKAVAAEFGSLFTPFTRMKVTF